MRIPEQLPATSASWCRCGEPTFTPVNASRQNIFLVPHNYCLRLAVMKRKHCPLVHSTTPKFSTCNCREGANFCCLCDICVLLISSDLITSFFLFGTNSWCCDLPSLRVQASRRWYLLSSYLAFRNPVPMQNLPCFAQ